MASYYKNMKIVNREIDNLIAKIGIGQKLSVPLLIYEITLNYEISEKAVYKRLDLLEEIQKIKIVNKEIEVLK